MLCMTKICSSTYFRIASCTRSLYSTLWCSTETDLDSRSWLKWLSWLKTILLSSPKDLFSSGYILTLKYTCTMWQYKAYLSPTSNTTDKVGKRISKIVLIGRRICVYVYVKVCAETKRSLASQTLQSQEKEGLVTMHTTSWSGDRICQSDSRF